MVNSNPETKSKFSDPNYVTDGEEMFRSVQLFFVSATKLEMFYLNSTLNLGIPPVVVFQLEVYYKVDRLLTGLTAQQKGTTARWYSNKISLC